MEKTLVFITIIVLGWWMCKKLPGSAEKNGIKALILNLALPATIFIALLKINLETNLFWLPLLAMVANILMIFGALITLHFLQIERGSVRYRTVLLLFPSFAPGLSCFPFLIEYFGDEMLANAAFADVGNKIFVLFILYIWSIKMYFHHVKNPIKNDHSLQFRLGGILKSLLTEPINLVMIVGVMMLCLGLDLNSLPFFIGDTIGRIGLMMTPLILLFIGLSLQVSLREVGGILQILLMRSGVAFFISALLLLVLPSGLAISLLILAVLFPQSACSFWPFAHMNTVQNMREGEMDETVFDLKFCLNILAFSLPLSTAIVVGVCSYPDLFSRPDIVFYASFIMIGCSTILLILSRLEMYSISSFLMFKRKNG